MIPDHTSPHGARPLPQPAQAVPPAAVQHDSSWMGYECAMPWLRISPRLARVTVAKPVPAPGANATGVMVEQPGD
jgi:hypothetical protein